MKDTDNNLSLFQSFVVKGSNLASKERNGAVIYTRVSTKEQAENNASLQTQKKYCELFAKRRELNIIEYFGGTYESAKSDERKEFQKMLSYVKRHSEIGYIIVYSFDRFSRTGTNGSFITEQLKNQGILVCSATQEVDSTTSSGSFQQDLFFLFSKFDNEVRKDKSVSGMREKLRKGYITGSIPFGYTNLNPGKGKLPDLAINKDGELLKKAFLLKAQHNLTYNEIADRLKKFGWRKPPKRFYEYFKNPFYCGIIVSSLLPDEIVEGNHPALISKEVFLKVNDLLSEHASGYIYNKDEENLPLKQFIKAESCGTHYTGYLVKKKGIYYYKNNRIGSCENKSAKAMHELFVQLLSCYTIVNSDLKEPIKEMILEACIELQKDSIDTAIALEGNLTKIQNDLETIEKRFVLGQITPELYSKYKDEFEKELVHLKGEIQKSSFNLSNLEKAIDIATEYALNLPQLWTCGDLEEKRRIQKMVFPEGIVYDFKNHHYRTPRVNSLFSSITEISRVCVEKKNGTDIKFDDLSRLVPRAGIEPAHPKVQDFESSASTSSATEAFQSLIKTS